MPIYLVRHGQTDSNRERIIQTPLTPLSKLGESQAQQFANHYGKSPIELIVCSDYTRTKQTAAPLQQSLGCNLIYSELFRERNFGDIRGKHYDDIGEDFFHPDYQPANGESHSQFARRVAQAWQSLQKIESGLASDAGLLVMTHGLVLKEIISTHLAISDEELAKVDLVNTCVTVVTGFDDKSIIKLADSSHLSEEITSEGAV